MADIEEEERSYQDCLEELFDSLTLLKGLLNTSVHEVDELYKQLGTIEDSLETVLNWIKLEKNALRNFETILEWSKKLALDSTLSKDDIRSRLRIMVLPQIESFTQNLATGEKSALQIVDVVTKNLEELPQFLKDIQQQNFKLLTTIGYEPDGGTSYLDLALFNLYQGRFKDFEKELSSLRNNVKPPQTSSHTEI
ncbi:MAG: hypothetical protein ACFE95_00680 [Candidatus Hodarchaeota archaeon]